MSKHLYYSLSFLFLLFAVVQYNDADWYIWMPAYGVISWLFYSATKRSIHSTILYSLMGIFTIWFLWLIPDLISWIKMGMPNITGSMKATHMEIELMREFLGIFICIIALWFLMHKQSKIKQG